MSWFNLFLRFTRYNPWTCDIEKVIHVDAAACREAERFVENAITNRGNVKVYDEIREKYLTEDEIKQLENEPPSVYVPFINDEDFIEVPRRIVAKATRAKTRKYKPRIPISKQLRTAVYQLYDHKCHKCNSETPNQIHHIDGDRSNNSIKNLELLCYECHLKADGKQITRYTTK